MVEPSTPFVPGWHIDAKRECVGGKNRAQVASRKECLY